MSFGKQFSVSTISLKITRIYIDRLTQCNVAILQLRHVENSLQIVKMYMCMYHECTCMYMYKGMYMYVYMSSVCKYIISPHSLMGNAIVSDKLILMSCSANVALGYAHARRVHVNNFCALGRTCTQCCTQDCKTVG